MTNEQMRETLVITDQYAIPQHEIDIPKLEFDFLSDGFDVPGIVVDKVNLGAVDMSLESVVKLRDYLSYWIENWPQKKQQIELMVETK